ncbi:hypothetical protein NHX12_013168 [Muraenolepis orangiensis]|uniref:Uncharacterized protein n=1 Tax=Muraenolepis orangiensis TaxID=630683 RepID=A0A9Q0DGX2_9TELE|nr:hypothetical protein NHX12_013168 [Muraenolepis orangiensis]
MPLNIRAKPSQSRLSALPKVGGPRDVSPASLSSRSSGLTGRKDRSGSTPGCRSGLEPGSVSGGGPTAPRPKPRGSPLPDARRASGWAAAPGGKTLSVENIQSVSAAYATSGAIYPSGHGALEPSGGYPKDTMTLGRSTGRASRRGRSAASGSSPNISSSGIPHPDPYGNHPDPYGNPDRPSLQGGPSGPGGHPGRQQPVREGSTPDLRAQLRELQKENEQLRREMDGEEGGRRTSGPICVNVWSPEVNRERACMRTSMDQNRVNQEDGQQPPLTVKELQDELRAHRETNRETARETARETNRETARETNSYRDIQADPDPRESVGPSPRWSPVPSSVSLLSPQALSPRALSPRALSPRALSPSDVYDPGNQDLRPADVLVHGTGFCPPDRPTQNHGHRPCGPCPVQGWDGSSSPAEVGFRGLRPERERKAEELLRLRRSTEDTEESIQVQKKTLGARDQSIQRLPEMPQGRGAPEPGVIPWAALDGEAQLENLSREVGVEACLEVSCVNSLIP